MNLLTATTATTATTAANANAIIATATRYPIHFGQMKAPLISYGAEGSGNTGTEVGTCTFKAFECQARVSTFYPAKCMRTCTLDYAATEADFVDLVEDECDKGAGSSLYMAGKSTATNGPSSFNVQMSDSYFYSC